MVIDNPYYTKIEKPVEIVHELKTDYEVPSFEEFMKSYQVDEKVNYADLSDGSVGEVGGYGPCYYDNANCTCYTSSGWVQLYLGCPAIGCGDQGKNPSTWVHASCGKPIYISKYLDIKCINCQNPSHMLNWKFNCFSDKHKGGYKETSYSIFFNALILLGGDAKNRDPRIRDIVKTISDKLWDM